MRIFTVGRSRAPVARKKNPLSAQRLFNTPPSHYQPDYEELKKEEHRQFSRKRIRLSSQGNDTCALSLDLSEIDFASILNDETALLRLCKSLIIEHASRRVDFMFYTFTAYYQTGILPVEGHTDFQYGIGQGGTQACHSSFIPSLLDETIYKNKWDELNYKSLLSRTHFLQSLNATVELPPFVNAFDDILESLCRPMCLVILREVSLGNIDPVEGLANFLSMMDTILQDFKQQASRENYASLVHPNLHIHRHVNLELIDLVIQGTLDTSYDSESGTVNKDYLQLLLRMTPEEKGLGAKNAKKMKKIYLEKIRAIQSEILETHSEESICAI